MTDHEATLTNTTCVCGSRRIPRTFQGTVGRIAPGRGYCIQTVSVIARLRSFRSDVGQPSEEGEEYGRTATPVTSALPCVGAAPP